MALSLDGDTGISGIDGSATSPAIKGTQGTSGLYFDSTSSRFVSGGANIIEVNANGLACLGNVVSNALALSGYDIDCRDGNYFTKTCNGNTTFTISNVPASVAFTFALEITHTSGTLTWPASIKWPADTPPTLTSGRTHVFVFVTDDGGVRWRGAALVDYVN